MLCSRQNGISHDIDKLRFAESQANTSLGTTEERQNAVPLSIFSLTIAGEFIEKAEGGLPGSWNSFPLAITTKTVVEQALRDSRRNRAVSAPGAVASAAKVGTKLLPDNWIAALLDRMRGI